MTYKRELDFIKKLFEKSGISLKVTPTKDFVEAVDIYSHTFYKLTDVLGLHYIFFLLPETDESTLLLIGPYESSDMTMETGSLMSALDIFCETIWGGKENYKETVIDGELKNSFSSFSWENSDTDQYIFSFNMRQMETRYAYENEILSAVSAGHSHKAEIFFPDTTKHLR